MTGKVKLVQLTSQVCNLLTDVVCLCDGPASFALREFYLGPAAGISWRSSLRILISIGIELGRVEATSVGLLVRFKDADNTHLGRSSIITVIYRVCSTNGSNLCCNEFNCLRLSGNWEEEFLSHQNLFYAVQSFNFSGLSGELAIENYVVQYIVITIDYNLR